MAPRTLDRSVIVHRIGTAGGRYDVWSGEGARLNAGRWHAAGCEVIYAAMAYSTALLEILARAGEMPKDQHRVAATIPPGVSYEELGTESVKDWSATDRRAAMRFGTAWYEEARSCLLIVPSVVTWIDQNVVVNAAHPEAGRIETGRETRVRWDERLFGG